MIDREAIKKLALKYQTTNFNILREYSQNLFLSQLYIQKHSDRMLFKGGTALRLIYNSPRFSEDLDFTVVKRHGAGIEDMIQDTLLEVERFGIRVKIDEFSETSGGYIGFVSMWILDEKLSIEFNISKRLTGHQRGETVLISNDFIPAYNLIQLAQEELVDEKIKALFERGKPRDFFDLYFILRANLLSAGKNKILHKVLDRLKKKEYNFAKELKIFLPKSYHVTIKDFSARLQREIERRL